MLKGSLLIYGSNQNVRQKQISKVLKDLQLKESDSNPDLLKVELLEDKKSIGIDQVRKLISFLSEKPYQYSSKAVIIEQAQKLTADAQNALLKILEEPPSYATIMLCTRTEEELLPTVLSRCQKVRVVNDDSEIGDSDTTDTIYSVIQMSLGERLSWAETQSKEEKEDIINLLENWVSQEREAMIKTNSDQKRRNLETLIQIKNDLEKTNVGVRLALEFLVLHLG